MTETDTIATAAAATPATEEATDLAALAELTAQRSAVYRLLARLYRVEVDEEFLAELKTMRFPAATGNTAVDTGYRTIATYLSGADAHRERLRPILRRHRHDFNFHRLAPFLYRLRIRPKSAISCRVRRSRSNMNFL